LSPESYREYMRHYMRDYQRTHRNREKYNGYMKVLQTKLRESARKIFCPMCETKFERRRYERHPAYPNCGSIF